MPRPLNETDYKSLDFVVFRTLAKIFETFSQGIINECRLIFNLPSVNDIISKQKINFLVRYSASENLLCKVFESDAEREIKTIVKQYEIRTIVCQDLYWD